MAYSGIGVVVMKDIEYCDARRRMDAQYCSLALPLLEWLSLTYFIIHQNIVNSSGKILKDRKKGK
jgi:hypothetical protein